MPITANSAQVVNSLPNPTVIKNRPTDFYGRLRALNFIYKTTGLETTGSVITLCALFPGAKVVGGTLVFGAVGAGATASVGLQYGLGYIPDGNIPIQTQGGAATGTEFLNAGSVAAAGTLPIASTIAQNFGYQIANPPATSVNQSNIQPLLGDNLLLTTGGATYAAGILIEGYLTILVD